MLDCLRRWMSASISDGSVFGMSSRLVILGCLGHNLGQAPTSAKPELDWIHLCHAVLPQGDRCHPVLDLSSSLRRNAHPPQQVGKSRVVSDGVPHRLVFI